MNTLMLSSVPKEIFKDNVLMSSVVGLEAVNVPTRPVSVKLWSLNAYPLTEVDPTKHL